MNVLEFMKKLDGESFQTPGTVDCFKFGDETREVKTVVTCLTASVDVLKKAKELGADLIVTHEPTFYSHIDQKDNSLITKLKSDLVEEVGIPLCRYHDHMHFDHYDMISEAFLAEMGWEGTFDGAFSFELKEAMTPLEMAKDIEEKLDLKHVRIVGKRDGKVTKVGLFLGHRGDDCWGYTRECEKYEVAIGGEWCEWANGEVIRDAAQFGYQISAIMLGHAGSERASMKHLADSINKTFENEGITAHYVECGELFTYTD